MSALPTPDQSTCTLSTPRATHLPPSNSKSQRVLACVLCQRRKVKCDRKFPCGNCIKQKAQCVPATQPRQRRRRFPERDLLAQLRKYEDLLRRNNVKFEPLHKDHGPGSGQKESLGGVRDSDDELPEAATRPDWSTPSTPFQSEKTYDEAKDIWHAMKQGSQGASSDSDTLNDGVREGVAKAWDQSFDSDDHILFGSRNSTVDLSTLHPGPVHIFRLWQIYLDNVNPLLKVTHTPTLQGRIIEAASSLRDTNPALEALMFSIYCMATLTLSADGCQSLFGLSKGDLLTKYQFGCQQALLNCGLLRTRERDCLTGLYLYLVSVQSSTDPRSLSSMLGVAMRIAQRMGIHDESANSRCTILEAEMRRRLWWSLMLFDTRIGELAECKSTMLAPTWDCKVPLNVNDSDLRPEMAEPPRAQGKVSEAIFAVVRSEMSEFVRHAPFYLGFTNPALKPIAKDLPEGGDLAALHRMIEDEYLRFCDPNNPLHFMTIWTIRGHISKYRLLEYFWRCSVSPAHPTEAQRDVATSHAFSTLECDTKIMASPHTRGYLWLLERHFPFPAYIHIAQELRRRPVSKQADRAWEIMNDNYEAHFSSLNPSDKSIVKVYSLFRIFCKVILHAWEAVEAAFQPSGEPPTPPRIVSSIRQKKGAEMAQMARGADTEGPNNITDTDVNAFLMSTPMGLSDPSPAYGMGVPDGYAGAGPGVCPNIPGKAPFGAGFNQLNWSPMGWGLGGGSGW